MEEVKRIYKILFSYTDGYIVLWSWENYNEWHLYDTAHTFWGAKWKIRKAEKELSDPFVIGLFNGKGKKID